MTDRLDEIRKRLEDYCSSRVTIVEQNRLHAAAPDDMRYMLGVIAELQAENKELKTYVEPQYWLYKAKEAQS